MSQRAIPNARIFDGWLRLPVSLKRVIMLTNLDVDRELWSALEYYSEVEDVGLNLIQAKGLQPQSDHQEIFKNFRNCSASLPLWDKSPKGVECKERIW